MPRPNLRAARFFHLEGPPERGRARLAQEDERHALRVLRMEPGDEFLAGDGRGRAWDVRVIRAERSGLELEVLGEPLVEAAPGEAGARGPRIELALALPRGGRSEVMLERLTQLGFAALRPLVSERVQGHSRELSAGRVERLERTLREACKQARRLWTPTLEASLGPAELAAAARSGGVVVLDPEAPHNLLDWARSYPDLGSARRPILIVVGPQGGLTPEERASLRAAGAHEARLGPHVLRIETAAESACAILGLAFER
jgi:16S rRNA (uracil1498-N3)-methyltransferase